MFEPGTVPEDKRPVASIIKAFVRKTGFVKSAAVFFAKRMIKVRKGEAARKSAPKTKQGLSFWARFLAWLWWLWQRFLSWLSRMARFFLKGRELKVTYQGAARVNAQRTTVSPFTAGANISASGSQARSAALAQMNQLNHGAQAHSLQQATSGTSI